MQFAFRGHLLLGLTFGAFCSIPVVAQAPEQYRASLDWEVGDLEGPMAFTRIGAVLPVGSRVFITQPMERTVRILSADGEPLGRLGRWGQGPGEFQRIESVAFIDGRLVVGDITLARVSVFDSEGELLETRPSPQLPPQPPLHFATLWFPAVGGYVLLFGTQLGLDGPPVQRLPGFLVAPDGSVADTLPSIRLGERTVVLRGGGRSRAFQLPVHDGERWAMAPDGTAFVWADDPSGEGLVVQRYDVRAGRVDRFRTGLRAVAVPRAYADSVRSSLIEFHSQGSYWPRRTIEQAILLPQEVPAADRVIIATSGEIWLRVPWFGSGPEVWRIMTPSGRLRAEAEVPPGSSLAAVDGETLWALREDEWGVNYLQRLRLERRGP
jgi:hypothetical protein